MKKKKTKLDRKSMQIFLFAWIFGPVGLFTIVFGIVLVNTSDWWIAGLVVAFVLSGVLSYFLARMFSRPIRNLNLHAKKIADGNYADKIEEKGYTEAKVLAQTLNYMSDELSKTEQLRKDLIANVTHDLNTPLTIIRLHAEMIEEMGDDKERREKYLKVIFNETDHLKQMITDILDMSKAENAMLDLKEFDFCELVNEVISHISVVSPQTKITVVQPQQLIVNADYIKIRQVINNLVSNAINHTDNNKIDITVVSVQNNRVRFEAQDYGCGIKPEDQKHIWERYYRTDQNHQRQIKGTGIGLSIVKSILISHDAAFGVDSTLGQGSKFWFEI